MRFLLLLFLCTTAVFVFGQDDQEDLSKLKNLSFNNPDDYSSQFLLLEEKFIKQEKNDLLFDLYGVHFDFLFDRDFYDSSMSILYKMLELRKDNPKVNSIGIYLNFASVYYFKGNYDSLIFWQNQAEKLIKTDSPFYGKYLFVSGYKSAFDGLYSEAIEKTLEAIKIFDATNDYKSLAAAYTNLALNYDFLDNTDNHVLYLLKAIEINKIIGNTYGLIANYNNLGIAYKKQNLLMQALTYYDSAYEILRNKNYPLSLPLNLTNRANILEKFGQFSKAELLFLECEQICKDYNIPFGLMLTNLNLGNLYRLQKRFTESNYRLRQGLKFSIELKTKRHEALAYERLSWLARDKADYKSAFDYNILFHNLNDSLVNESVKKEALELSEKYQAEKKENQIISLSKDKLYQKYIIFSLGCVFLGVMIILQWRRNRFIVAQHKRDKEQELLKLKLETVEKELLADSLKKVSVMYTKQSLLINLKEIIQELPRMHQSKFQPVLNDLHSNQDQAIINEFETRFLGVYENFFTKLKAIAPDLTPSELRIAALMRLNFSSKEIAAITNRTTGTIDNLRSNLRKKLKLSDDMNIFQKLLDI